MGLVIGNTTCIVLFSTINMSNKRQRVSGSTSQASKTDDKHIFINKATSKHYYSLLAGKVLILEWGIKPHETQDGGVADMIKEKGWENFT